MTKAVIFPCGRLDDFEHAYSQGDVLRVVER